MQPVELEIMVGTMFFEVLTIIFDFFQMENQTLYSFIYLVQEQAHGYIYNCRGDLAQHRFRTIPTIDMVRR